MAVRFYDEAIVNKIQSWLPENTLHVLKPDETARLFQIHNDKELDKPISLPLISLSRDSEYNLNLRTKNVLSFDGVKIGQTETETLHMDCIPIDLTYHLDIYTRFYDEADEYARNFIFKIINHPRFYIEIPYNNHFIKHIAYMRMNSTVVDNSDVPEKLFADEFTRLTLTIEIADAYLFSTPYTKNWKVEFAGLELDDGPLTEEELKEIKDILDEQAEEHHWTDEEYKEEFEKLKKQYLETHISLEKVKL